jgi:DNA-binding HxlR family transcriptional regulator
MGPQAAGLNSIARAEASPAQAREALLAVLGQPSAELLQDAYLALRAWAWKALDQRRRDPELREWDDLLCAAAALMAQHGQPALAERLTALHELLSESVAVSEILAAQDITRRQHVIQVLDFLASNGGQASRSAIGAHLSLDQANLTRVLNLMSTAGLVERTSLGKEAVFSLSRSGLDAQRARLNGLGRTGSPPRVASA